MKESTKKRRKEITEYIQDYKKDKFCETCGENHPACLHFHHKDPEQKKFKISHAPRLCGSIKKLLEEINKCEIICGNCHAKLHYEERIAQLEQS